MKIAIIQITSNDDKKGNLDKIVRYIDEAVNRGVQLIALPENFSYLQREGDPWDFSETLDGEVISLLKSLAIKHQVYILAGSIPETIINTNKIYNTSCLINNEGNIVGSYRKIHLFDVILSPDKEYRESNFVEPGGDVVVLDTPWCKVGLSICYDLRFPELYRILTFRGAKIIFIPSAFVNQTGCKHWEILLRARAIENQVYIVAPNQYGYHGKGRSSFGDSMVIDPWGTPIARSSDKEGFIIAEIDLDYLDEVRKKIPCSEHCNQSILGSFNVDINS